MTITEYRNILFDKIGKTGGGVAEGLKEALELSESLYDNCNNRGNHAPYMTNRELAELLAKGYGQMGWISDEIVECIYTYYDYYPDDNIGDDTPVDEDVRIRAWGSEGWSKPLASIYKAWKMGTLVSIGGN